MGLHIQLRIYWHGLPCSAYITATGERIAIKPPQGHANALAAVTAAHGGQFAASGGSATSSGSTAPGSDRQQVSIVLVVNACKLTWLSRSIIYRVVIVIPGES